MKQTKLLVGVVWVPVLSSCMLMGGLGHVGSLGGVHDVAYAESATRVPLYRAQASNGGLTIVLSFPSPSYGTAVAIDAWLTADSTHFALTDSQVWLRIQTPSGHVDQIRMQRRYSGATYQAHYRFPTSGLYLVTAEGRTGTRADLRTVSVTVDVEAGGAAQVTSQHWLMPAPLVGSLGMIAMWAIVASGS